MKGKAIVKIIVIAFVSLMLVGGGLANTHATTGQNITFVNTESSISDNFTSLMNSTYSTAATILPVPYEWQDGAGWCVPASGAMVLRYFGMPVHVWSIADDLNLSHACLDMTVKRLSDYIAGNYSPEIAIEYTEWVPGTYAQEDLKDCITTALDAGKPVIFGMHHPDLAHAAVIVGYSNNSDTTFYVNDPSGELLGDLGIEYSVPDNIIARPVNWSQLSKYTSYNIDTASVEGNPNPPNGSLSFGDYSIEIKNASNGLLYYTWLNDGIKWKDASTGMECPIDSYNVSFNSTDYMRFILSMLQIK